MAEFFHGRRLRFEIMALVDRRWQIVRVIEDNRDELGRPFDRLDFEKLEREVESAASRAFSQPGVAAVKVIRERQRDDGFVSRAELSHRRASSSSADGGPAVIDASGPVPLCRTPDDLLGRPACKVIGSMLRPLLERLGVTPVELLTLEAGSLAVSQQESTINAAVGLAARAQAGARDGAVLKQRSDFLSGAVDRARQRVKLAQAERNMPKLGPGGFDVLLEALRIRVAPGDLRFWAFRGLSSDLKGLSSLGKLERCLDLLGDDSSAMAVGLLDEFIAGLADAPSLLKDVLGGRPDLRSALDALGQLAAGRTPEGMAGRTPAARLAAELASYRLPNSHEALWFRILRSLDGRHRLTRGDLDAEWAGLTALQRVFDETVPAVWRDQLKAAIARRQTFLRTDLMERLR